MKNYKLEIQYDGSRYFGWEHQPGKETIQGKIEAVLEKMCGAPAQVIGAGRTDAGVHAKGMVANVHLDTNLTEEEMLRYLNHYLPADICISDLRICSDRFHARYNAVGKTYTYTCYVGSLKPVFQRKYVTVLEKTPDIEKMKAAAAYLIGEHDFKSFAATQNQAKTTVRIIDSIEIFRKKDFIYLNFHGTGFLRNQVRNMTGTLLEVGYGERTPESVREILEAKDRRVAGGMAPAEGLCLMQVDY